MQHTMTSTEANISFPPKVDYHRSSFNQLITITLNHIKPTKLKPIIGKKIVNGILPINTANSPANASNPFCIIIMKQVIIVIHPKVKIPSIIPSLLPHAKTGDIVSKYQRSPTLITLNDNQVNRYCVIGVNVNPCCNHFLFLSLEADNYGITHHK